MAQVFLNSTPMNTVGTLPVAGSIAPDFELTGADLSELKLGDFKGKRLVLNIFPSLDTDVCAASVRHFNKDAASMPDTIVLCVSMDLPFAAARFCTANGIENVKTASAFRSDFGARYSVTLADGPLKGLLARALVVIDRDGRVLGSSLNQEITEEPDYGFVTNLLRENP